METSQSNPAVGPTIHPSALVDGEARLGDGVRIGPFAVIEGGVEIGAGSVVAAHAVVRRGSILGANVRIDSMAVIGGDPQDVRFDRSCSSGVWLGQGVVVRESVTVHRSTKPGGLTSVGEGVMLMACSHVAHDCQVGAQTILANGVLLAGHVQVGPGCFLGGLAVVHQFVRIGEGVMASGRAGIGLDVPPFALIAERNELHGLNLVGIKRRGWPPEDRIDLKACYQAVYGDPGNPAHRAAEALAGGLGRSPPGRSFLEFFKTTRRGFIRPPRHGAESAKGPED